jgi:hypothetical protein
MFAWSMHLKTAALWAALENRRPLGLKVSRPSPGQAQYFILRKPRKNNSLRGFLFYAD